MALDSGTRIGPFEVQSLLGVGGMGEVYRARDTKLGREVAIKVLPAALAGDAGRMARFGREAQVLASLNHPNIASIYGLEDSTGVRALVMELVEGVTLAERLGSGARGTGLPLDEALQVARQVAEALEAAHEKGIVHRDLKPANVKIRPDGTVKVLDFGLAKALETEAAGAVDASKSPTLSAVATQAGVILGTAAYMSPEQARGRAVDRRADVWAFGCVLFEMLSGAPAFHGETVTDTLAAVIKEEPNRAALPAGTPARIRDLLFRCLRKDPRQRLRDVGDARIAIEEALAGASDEVAPPSGRPGRSGWSAGVVGLLVGALVAGLAAFGLLRPAPPVERHFRAVTSLAGVQAEPALSPDGRSVAFVSNRDGPFDVYVGLVGGGSLVQITHDANLESRPCWSPDGTRLAYARLSDAGIWDVWEVPALGGTPRRLILGALDPAWSPDGKSLAYQNLADGRIWIADASGQNGRQATPGGATTRETQPRFSPNGREIALVVRPGGPYGEIEVVDLDSGTRRALTADGALALSPAWSPDGRFVYFASSRGGTMNLWKVAAAGGEPEQVTAGQGDDAQLDVSADGRRIVFSTFREKADLATIDLAAGPGPPAPVALAADPARNRMAPVYSPDGNEIAFFTNLKGVEKESIWVANPDGSDPVELVQDGRSNIFPRWTPDGGHLDYFSGPNAGEYRRVSVRGGAPETLRGGVVDWSFDIGRDGRLLFKSATGDVQTYDPASHETKTLVPSSRAAGWLLLRWSPDQRSFAYGVNPRQEPDDPNAGLWVEDLDGGAPRRIFPGWISFYGREPGGQIVVLEGKADLTRVLWTIDWEGRHRTRLAATLPAAYSYWTRQAQRIGEGYFDVSPDGHTLVFNREVVLQANIGMIENVQ